MTIRPTININGSSPEDLVEPRLAAFRHIGAAIEALKAATPNGRDYPGGIDRCVADREAHYARVEALRALQAALVSEAQAIRDQQKGD